MANITDVEKFFPTPNEEYISTVSATIAAGAEVVPVASATAYADGDVVVLVVEPKTANEAVFTGTKASSPDRFIDCVWTEGNVGVGHASGATVADYVTSTHLAITTKGLRKSLNQDGTLKDDSVTTAALADNSVTTAKIANKAVKATKIDLATLQFVDANGWRVTEGVKRTYRKIVSHPSASNIGSLVPANSITTSLPSGKSNTQVEIESVTPSSNTISYLYASAVTEPGLVRIQVRNVSGSAQNMPTTKVVVKLVDA